MIAKHVPIRSVKKSDFAHLAEYITSSQNKNERVGEIAITNCASSTLKAAINETLATQQLNTRAKSDKTYHLIVSFPPGEVPSSKTLKDIESRVCEGLGFEEHQRISAVHHDTDILHVHIAINKIHPVKLTIHEPYYSHRTLGELCTELEVKHDLQLVNHISHQRGSASRANDMECHSGIESLVGWIKRECLADINQAECWNDLHQVMNDNGLLLRKQGNGLIIESNEGVVIKASTLSRGLSKPQLEKKLGNFIPSVFHDEKPVKEYKKKPLKMKIDTSALYSEYLQERNNIHKGRDDALAVLKKNNEEQIAILKRVSVLKRAVIKLSDNYFVKKMLYAQASKTLLKRINNVNQHYRFEKQVLYQQHQYATWADWLKKKAITGNSQALDALRARPSKGDLVGNTLSGLARGKIDKLSIDNITKKGTVIYREGALAGVRDDGRQLQLPKKLTVSCVMATLHLAQQRYGAKLAVNGSESFKKLVAKTVVVNKLPIQFIDLELERTRETLQKEMNNVKRDNRGKADSRSDGDARSRSIADRNGERRAQSRGDVGEWVGNTKPDIGRVGRIPPPHSRHRLRSLSELGVVRVASGSEVLLQSDVPRDLEQQRAESDHTLRRGVSGTELSAGQAVKQYIDERELKRLQGMDVVKHVPFKATKEALSFAGMRNIEGQTLALLASQNIIMVLAVPESRIQHIKGLKIGQGVIVNKEGRLERARKVNRKR